MTGKPLTAYINESIQDLQGRSREWNSTFQVFSEGFRNRVEHVIFRSLQFTEDTILSYPRDFQNEGVDVQWHNKDLLPAPLDQVSVSHSQSRPTLTIFSRNTAQMEVV